MFIPPGVLVRDIPPLSLGNDFKILTIRTQGFHHTGSWFLMREDPTTNEKETHIHAIRFNSETSLYEHKLLVMKSPVYGGRVNTTVSFDPESGRLFLVAKRTTNEEVILHAHHLNISDFLPLKFKTISIEVSPADFAKSYSKREFNDIGCSFDGSTLTFIALHYPQNTVHINAQGFVMERYSPRACIDIYKQESGEFIHSKHVLINFNVPMLESRPSFSIVTRKKH